MTELRVKYVFDSKYGTSMLVVNDCPISFTRIPDSTGISERNRRRSERLAKARQERDQHQVEKDGLEL